MKAASIIVASLIVGALRFTVSGHGLSWAGTYEALAHIVVGALLVVCFQKSDQRRLAIACVVLVTILETVMFLTR